MVTSLPLDSPIFKTLPYVNLYLKIWQALYIGATIQIFIVVFSIYSTFRPYDLITSDKTPYNKATLFRYCYFIRLVKERRGFYPIKQRILL